MIASALGSVTPRAQAMNNLTTTTLVSLAATAVAVYLVAAGPPSVEASSKNKEAALRIVAEDAAVFIMNDGEGASDLLISLMTEMRSKDEFKKLTETVTDLDLAYAILEQADVDLE